MNRDELIAAMRADGADTPQKVEVKNWGVIYVMPPLVDEVQRQQEEEADGEKPLGVVYAQIAARMICDENGKRIFDPENEDDIALLRRRREADLQAVILAGRGLATGN